MITSKGLRIIGSEGVTIKGEYQSTGIVTKSCVEGKRVLICLADGFIAYFNLELPELDE